MTELKPCPFCGGKPELVLEGDDTYAVECNHHEWTKRDEDGVRFAGDIGVYAEAKTELNSDGEWVVTKSSLDDAKRKVVELWNRRAGERDAD